MKNPKEPYNELPLLPPELKMTDAIYKKAISANKALAELKGLAGLIPNQVIIVNSLTLREAKDSSEIENIITTQDDLYQAFSSDEAITDPAIKEVLNYRQALWRGYQIVNDTGLITTKHLINIQEILVGNNAGLRKQPGTTLKNVRSNEVIYTPPYGNGIIEKLLKNLEDYINREQEIDIDPLIKMAVIHYQFESIHPFYDGNGRTGRILNALYLIHQKLLDLPILYLSSYIIKYKQDYYRLLQQVRFEEKWEEWILYILNGVEQTATSTITLIRKIRDLLQEEIAFVQENCPKIYSKELVESLFYQPYCRISTLEENLNITRFTASKYLKQLEEVGVLESKKVGRTMLYVNKKLFQALKESDDSI